MSRGGLETLPLARNKGRLSDVPAKALKTRDSRTRRNKKEAKRIVKEL
jgi:hypothetical protein